MKANIISTHLQNETMIPVKILLHRFICLLASSILLHQIFFAVPTLASTFTTTEQRAAIEKMLSVIRSYGLKDTKTLEAMGRVARHKFVPETHRKYSYSDTPLKIGYGQTISQPYIVAEMTKQLKLDNTSKVLEIGTGSGYQAAVLAEITPHVYSVEIIEPLLKQASKTLQENGYTDIRLRHGDGYYGWPEASPFDAIIVTCAAGHIPPPLLSQLSPNGRMLIPVGKRFGTQYLIMVTKNTDGSFTSKNLMAVRFVPLVRK